VWEGGANAWFFLHAAQAVVFRSLAFLGFRRLEAAQRKGDRVSSAT
jgi:hypothetical protein